MDDNEKVLKTMEYRIMDCIEEALGIATAYQFQKKQEDSAESISTVLEWGMEVGVDEDHSKINQYLEELVNELYNRIMDESDKLHTTMTIKKEQKQ